MVTIDFLGNGGNELDESFSVVICRCGLSSNADNSWNKLVLSLVSWSIKDLEVSMNNIKNVHELSLILMNSLDLDIIHGVDWNFIASLFFNPNGKFLLVLLFDLDELILELLIIGIWDQISQVVKSSDPLINTSESITDKFGKLWVAAMNPSSWGNTVGLVLELTWIEGIEFTENGLLKKFRMEGSNTVDGMGADNSKISHSDFLWPSFFNQ